MNESARKWHCFNAPNRSLESFIDPLALIGKGGVIQNLSFGDCQICPAEILLNDDLFYSPLNEESSWMLSLKGVCESNSVYRIASDADGTRYYQDALSGQSWAWHHDPDEFVSLGITQTTHLLHWLSNTRSGLPTLQSWGVFFTDVGPGAYRQVLAESVKPLNLLEIEASLQTLSPFDFCYHDANWLSAYNVEAGLLIEAGGGSENGGAFVSAKLRSPNSVSDELRQRLETWWVQMKEGI